MKQVPFLITALLFTSCLNFGPRVEFEMNDPKAIRLLGAFIGDSAASQCSNVRALADETNPENHYFFKFNCEPELVIPLLVDSPQVKTGDCYLIDFPLAPDWLVLGDTSNLSCAAVQYHVEHGYYVVFNEHEAIAIGHH